MVSSRRRRLAAATTTSTTTKKTTTAPPVEAHLDDELRRAKINAANNAELRANAHDVLATIRTSRPKNTSRAYEPKQREFKVRDKTYT